MLFFFAETGGFYDDTINPPIPKGAVQITPELHRLLLQGEASGQRISADTKGQPILVDPPPPTDESLAAIARQWRDKEIASVQWLRDRHRDEIDSDRSTTMTKAQSGELLDYVQLLRDWPKAPGFPLEASKPPKPVWITEQSVA